MAKAGLIDLRLSILALSRAKLWTERIISARRPWVPTPPFESPGENHFNNDFSEKLTLTICPLKGLNLSVIWEIAPRKGVSPTGGFRPDVEPSLLLLVTSDDGQIAQAPDISWPSLQCSDRKEISSNGAIQQREKKKFPCGEFLLF